MSLDTQAVQKIARLARINVPEAECKELASELNQILNWVEQLSEVDTADTKPMTSAIPNKLRWREDVVTDGDKVEDVLANAAEAKEGFFVVPKVVE